MTTSMRKAQEEAEEKVATGLEKKGSFQLGDGTLVETALASFRRQLRETRKSAGLSQAALAEKVARLGGALQTTAITRIERGDRDVSLEDVLLLAAALDVSPLYLIVPREGGVMARLAPRGRSYSPIHLREWIRGQWSLDTVGALRVSTFFASERALDELVLWSEKYLVHRICTMLAGTVAADILRTEGVLSGIEGMPDEEPEHRLEAIERRLRTVVEEVESYVAGRRRQLTEKED